MPPESSRSHLHRSERPRLLDLFCGAGGCSVGYQRAGFEVVGVDIDPHPAHPGNDAAQELRKQALVDAVLGPPANG